MFVKLLHTADWHLGKHLEGHSRLPEQKILMKEIVEIAARNNVDLVLISGDIYDTFNPPAEAEKLFYRTVHNLACGGERIVCIIAGNHDSPNRLAAPGPLTCSQGIIIMDRPHFQLNNGEQNEKVIDSGTGYVELELADERVVLLSLPYPSENRLNSVLGEIKEEQKHQQDYSRKIGTIFAKLEQHYRPESINLALSHLFVAGGEKSESERPIQVGGGLTVSREHLPDNSQYTALGHLHQAQPACRDKNAYYAGSPLQYSVSERNQTKSVSLVELHPGQEAEIERINLRNVKPIEVWSVEGIEQALELCRDNQNREVWAYLKIKTEKPLLQSDIKKIKKIKEDILSIMPLTSEEFVQENDKDLREDLNIKELFKEYYKKERETEPGSEVMEMLATILRDEED
ncbi:MAG: metallophosphoesterase family protein [Bacillota bacterium]